MKVSFQFFLMAIILTILLVMLFSIPEFNKLITGSMKNNPAINSVFSARAYTLIHITLILVHVWLGSKELHNRN